LETAGDKKEANVKTGQGAKINPLLLLLPIIPNNNNSDN
jgi:hypothetical protein